MGALWIDRETSTLAILKKLTRCRGWKKRTIWKQIARCFHRRLTSSYFRYGRRVMHMVPYVSRHRYAKSQDKPIAISSPKIKNCEDGVVTKSLATTTKKTRELIPTCKDYFSTGPLDNGTAESSGVRPTINVLMRDAAPNERQRRCRKMPGRAWVPE